MRNVIQLGESLRLYTDYIDPNTGAMVDPSILSASIRQPDGTVVLLDYPASDFVREDLGFYFVRFFPTQVGTHRYAITATYATTDKDVRHGKFDVEAAL